MKKLCYCDEMLEKAKTMYQVSFGCPKHGAVVFIKPISQQMANVYTAGGGQYHQVSQ